jgi:hypothetical protein
VVVDAKEGARDFYLKNELVPFATQPDRLFLLMKKIDPKNGSWEPPGSPRQIAPGMNCR